MKNSSANNGSSRLVLIAKTAAELMAPNPVSIRDNASIGEAMALLAAKDVDAVPVIDEAGRPIGVLSQGDILVHEREAHSAAVGVRAGRGPGDSRAPTADGVLVRDIMTPALFAVTPETSAARVVEQLLTLKVNQLFVVEPGGALIGFVQASDILRHLQPSRAEGGDA